MRQLTTLEINGRPLFDDVALDHFCALANLTELDLNECRLSGAALKRFRGRVTNCTILLGDNEAPTLDAWEYEKWLLGLRDLQFAP